MKKALLIIALFQLFTLSYGQTYKTKKPRVLTWKGKAAYNSYRPSGEIKLKSAQLRIEENTLQSLELIIDMKSLQHDNRQLQNHLRDKDFFEVQKFPEARFTLKEPVSLDEIAIKVRGYLTIKEKTEFEEFDVTLVKLEDEVVLQFKVKVDRTDYGVNFNSPSFFQNLKENAIDNDFQLKGRIQLFSK